MRTAILIRRKRPEGRIHIFEDPDRYQIRFAELVGLCDLPDRDLQLALRALGSASPPYFEAQPPPAGLTYPNFITDVTERARRTVGQWPTAESLVTEISNSLAQAADCETDPQRRSRLRDAALVIGDSARSIAVEVASRFIEHQAGMD